MIAVVLLWLGVIALYLAGERSAEASDDWCPWCGAWCPIDPASILDDTCQCDDDCVAATHTQR